MANLNLPNVREGGDIRFRIGLEDNGVAVDWSGLEGIRVFLYADAQKQVSGECTIEVDAEDNTVLACLYSGDDPQFRGINSVLVRAKYQGEIKVYDKPAINIVARTADADGVLVIDDPVVPVQINVEEVSTSLLNNAIDAAINAAAGAEKAIEDVRDEETAIQEAEAARVLAEQGRVSAEQSRVAQASADHTLAGQDHTRAESDHGTASDDHTLAVSDHGVASGDHTTALGDHSLAESDHTRAESDHGVAGSDHTIAQGDHTQAGSDHSTAVADHTQAGADHTVAGQDHTQAGTDHNTAASDHTQAGLDHTQAGEDHTQALADHQVMAGYDNRLGAVEGEVDQLEAKVDEGEIQVEIVADGFAIRGYAIRGDGTAFNTNINYKHILFSVRPGDYYNIIANGSNYARFAFFTSSTVTPGGAVPYVTGTYLTTLDTRTGITVKIPLGCNYLYIYSGFTGDGDGMQNLPSKILLVKSADECDKTIAGTIFDVYGKLQVPSSEGYVINSSTGELREGDSDRLYSTFIKVQGLTEIRYSRPVTSATSPTWGMAFYGSDKQFLSGQSVIAGGTARGYADETLSVPINAVYARFSWWADQSLGDFYVINTGSLREELNDIKKDFSEIRRPALGISKKRVISPEFIYIGYRAAYGDILGTYKGVGLYSTPRYIGVLGDTISISVGKDLHHITVLEYDSDFSFIQSDKLLSISANTKYDYTLQSNTAYIKLSLCKAEDNSEDSKTTVKVEGIFRDKWDVFNLRSADSGYQRIAVSVRVTDPNCCDNEGNTVQDSSQILTDYGIICLPPQYSNIGKPTRMIIYCHGAAVNYSSSVNRFDPVDLEPDYWLAEGYAVMDIEGNPFNNSDEHLYIPQAMDCYVAAYKWAIEYYNICRDGVFVGGRSMGGGMAFGLMRSQCPIPVIACCPNVPSAMCVGGSTNTRQKFFAEHCGFEIPEGFDWTTNYADGNIETNGSKKKLFYDNWDKLVKNVPIWGMSTDLPTSEDGKKALVNHLYGGSIERVHLWEGLHIISRCPVKLFGCNQDETCPPPETSALYYRMLTNAGQIAELRLFNSYKDYSGTGTSAHHYDTQDPALRADITTSFGEELEDVPIVYIEMLAFWRRYEQGL